MYRQNSIQSIALLLISVSVFAPACRGAAQQTDSPPANSPAEASADALESEPVPAEPKSWVDDSHGYMTEQTNALTRWVDNFFGDREADVEQAESRLRVRLVQDWDETLGNSYRVRVGGKVDLPKLSKRLDLVFRGDDPDDEIAGRQDPAQSRIGLQYQLGNQGENRQNRLDLTVGLSASGPRPGVRYRYAGLLGSPRNPIRFTQRVQYEFDDGAFATTRLDIDHRLTDYSLLRSFTRVFWGEESEGVEWSTAFGHAERWSTLLGRERATFIYAGVSGKTKPTDYEDNYFVGARYRMQAYRDYLFFEIEPSYNWRVDTPGVEREGAAKIELRLELLLDNNLRRDGRRSDP